MHKQQTDFLYNDINHVLLAFKKALYSMQSTELLLPVEKAKPDTITAVEKIIGFEDEFVFKVPLPRVSFWCLSLSLSLLAPSMKTYCIS